MLEDRYLFLQVDASTNQVWYNTWTKGDEIQNSGMTPEDFVSRQSALLDHYAPRVWMSPRNAILIAELLESQIAGRPPFHMELAAPTPGASARLERNLGLIITESGLAPSLGGWRRTVPRLDMPVYGLSRALVRNGFGNQARDYLESHPAWPAISFIGTHNWMAAAQLLTVVMDPRRFVDGQNPDRVNQLGEFLGVGKIGAATVQQVLAQEPGQPLRGADKAQVLVGTWFRGWPSPIPQELGSPNNFLYRIALKQLFGRTARPEHIAVMRASKVFLSFLRAVWLDRLTPSRVYVSSISTRGGSSIALQVPRLQQPEVYSPTLFVPEYFFRHQDEAQAWREHIAKFNNN